MNWKPIEGLPYAVSDYGFVRRTSTGRVKMMRLDSDDYLITDLYKGGLGRTLKIHRLVAQAFIPNPESKPQVNHKDFVRHNNVVTNLVWATASENIRHSSEAGRFWAQPSSRVITATHIDGNVEKFPSTKAAKRAGHNRAAIYLCLEGKQNYHHDRSWKYDETI